MVLLSSGDFIGPEMVLGYFISNNKSRYGFRLFYMLFTTFAPKGCPKSLLGNWAVRYRKNAHMTTLLQVNL